MERRSGYCTGGTHCTNSEQLAAVGVRGQLHSRVFLLDSWHLTNHMELLVFGHDIQPGPVAVAHHSAVGDGMMVSTRAIVGEQQDAK